MSCAKSYGRSELRLQGRPRYCSADDDSGGGVVVVVVAAVHDEWTMDEMIASSVALRALCGGAKNQMY